MVHSFVINRIDYCNSVLYGMSAVHMRPLQNVLNSAARVVLKMTKFQHRLLLQPSAISSTGCLWNNVFHATPSSLGRSRGSCGAAMQNNKIRKAKFSRVCSINLELTTDDRSRLFYFNDQLQWTFESRTVSQSLRNWLSAYVTVIC